MRSWVACLIVVAGCACAPPGSSFVQVRHARLSPELDLDDLDRLPIVQVFRTAQQLEAVREGLDFRRDGAAPPLAIDFAREHVVLISWGLKSMPGCAVFLQGVEDRGDRVVVHVQTVAPGPGEESYGAEQRRWPYLAVVVPARAAVEVVVSGDRHAGHVSWDDDDGPCEDGSHWLQGFAESDVTVSTTLPEEAGEALELKAFELGGYSLTWPQVRVMRRAEDYRSFYGLLSANGEARPRRAGQDEEGVPLAASPFAAVDFQREQVVVIAWGRKPNAGYHLRATSARRLGDRIVIVVETQAPGIDEMPECAEKTPSVSLLVPQAPRVEVVLTGDRHAPGPDSWEPAKPDFHVGRTIVRLQASTPGG